MTASTSREHRGVTHAMPDDLPAILRVNRDGSTTNVANLNQWHATNPPHFIKDTNPATTDQEPGGVFRVVETNRGFLLRVDPRTGAIETLYDMTIDDREHNPIVMTQRTLWCARQPALTLRRAAVSSSHSSAEWDRAAG